MKGLPVKDTVCALCSMLVRVVDGKPVCDTPHEGVPNGIVPVKERPKLQLTPAKEEQKE